MGRLTGADHTTPGLADEAYAYDVNGNRVRSHRHDDGGYATGPGDRLLSDGSFALRGTSGEGNLVRGARKTPRARSRRVRVRPSQPPWSPWSTRMQRATWPSGSSSATTEWIDGSSSGSPGEAMSYRRASSYDRDDVLPAFRRRRHRGAATAGAGDALPGTGRQVDQCSRRRMRPATCCGPWRIDSGPSATSFRPTAAAWPATSPTTRSATPWQRPGPLRPTRYRFAGREFDRGDRPGIRPGQVSRSGRRGRFPPARSRSGPGAGELTPDRTIRDGGSARGPPPAPPPGAPTPSPMSRTTRSISSDEDGLRRRRGAQQRQEPRKYYKFKVTTTISYVSVKPEYCIGEVDNRSYQFDSCNNVCYRIDYPLELKVIRVDEAGNPVDDGGKNHTSQPAG